MSFLYSPFRAYQAQKYLREKLGPARLLLFSFLVVILLGSGLLMLPGIPADGVASLRYVDALFTATSAVCVTGLIVRDTATELSPLGQALLLVLIQAGGLGIMTFSNLMILFLYGRLGARSRMVLEETQGILPGIRPAQILRRVFIYTFILEALGALLLFAWFSGEYPAAQAAWIALFHAVSAFCNAGFSVFSTSFTAYTENLYVNVVLMSLIILGGLGTVVLTDLEMLARNRLLGRNPLKSQQRHRLSLHSRVVLFTSAALIITGAVMVFFLELGRDTLPDSLRGKCAAALFASVTARTAGFNTLETGHLSNATLLVTMGLMVVGGSAGSTAGGVKTTTFAVAMAMLVSRLRNRRHAEMLRRTIPTDVCSKALFNLTLFCGCAVLAILALEVVQFTESSLATSRLLFIDHLFEVISALGTVGLSTGVTSDLSVAGKCIIIACMFLGRLGPVVVAFSVIGHRREVAYSYPEERIITG